jgi:hypothetical protein
MVATVGASLFAVMAASSPLLSSVAVVEEEVVFRLEARSGASVSLVGDFNGWNPTIDLMTPVDGAFEIQLYLLPGTYGYRFVVDGVSETDPDNPCMDEKGNSCFSLTEHDQVLEVSYSETAGSVRSRPKSDITPSLSVQGYATGDSQSVFSQGSLAGTVDGVGEAHLSVGWTGEARGDDAIEGRSFLVRCLASYRGERDTVNAFTRVAEAVSTGDPLALFGSVGPYRYPVGLFCRGMSVEGRLPFGTTGRVIYASRIAGYRSGLEGIASSSDLFSKRDLVDADMIGLRAAAKVGLLEAAYLLRQDRRPKEGIWENPDFGNGLFRGFEKARFQGFELQLRAHEGIRVEGELLFGTDFLEATGKLTENGPDFRDVSLEGKWENGRRAYLGVSRAGARTASRLSFTHTTLEGDPRLTDGRPKGTRSAIDAAFTYGEGALTGSLEGRFTRFSASNTGSIFWLGRTNFWLDGDEVSYDLIPFLSSREIVEARFMCAWRYEPLGALPWGRGLRFSISERGDPNEADRLFGEAVLSSGVAIHPRLTVLADLRAVSYRYEGMRRDAVNLFFAAHGSISTSLWCALGAGVNPYAFDRWLFEFSDHGRADYLADRGIFRALAAHGEDASVKTLLRAEEDLSEDWVVTFEAGFTF